MRQEELKFSNIIPTEEDLHKMVAKLVVEKAEVMERINDLLKENTEWKLENQRLNNVLNKYKNHLIKKMNEFVIYDGDLSEIYEEEYDYFYKLNELKESDK